MAFDANTGTLSLPDLSPTSVLVVSPNRDMADAMALLLEEWGYQATVAADPEQAADLTRTSSPNLVLMDLTATDVYYVERASRFARSHAQAAAVIAVHDDGPSSRLEQETVACVRAPFRIDDLEALVTSLCAARASQLH